MIMRIRDLRKAAGISQVQLGAAVGVGQNVVSQWETEVALPRTRQLPALACVLGCSIDELFASERQACSTEAS